MHHHPLYEFVRVCFTLTARVVFTQTYTALPSRVVVFRRRRRRLRRVFIMRTCIYIYIQLNTHEHTRDLYTHTRIYNVHIDINIRLYYLFSGKRIEREKSDFVFFFSPYIHLMYIQ